MAEYVVPELVMSLRKVRDSGNVPLWFNVCARIYMENKEIGRRCIKELRKELTARINAGVSRHESMQYLRQSYMLTGSDTFEEFMIAMEWDRAPAARFWMPRRKQLEGRLHVASTIQQFIDDKDAKFLSMSMPPGTGKTTLIKFLLAFIAGRFSDSMNMYISYSKGMVDVMYSSLLSMLTDSEYNFNEIFPEVPTLKTSAEYATLSYRPMGEPPTLGLVALGGSVTGRTRANRFFVTDDLVKNDEVARSPERLDTLYSDYKNTLTTRKIGDGVKEIMLGTIWSIHDPISRQREKYGNTAGYYFMALPLCDEFGHSNFNYDHPDRYTDEMVADLKRDLDPATFSALYMQRGIEKEGMAFSYDALSYYDGSLPDGDPDNVFFCADVAWGGGDSFSMPICYQYGESVYVHDVIFDNHDKSVTKPRVVGKILQHKMKMGQFEANNGGAEYCDDISRLLAGHAYSCHLTSKRAPANVKKLTRIEQHQDTIRKFYFLSEDARKYNPDYVRFMNELTTFSFTVKNKHDDAADSLAMVADFLYGRGVLSKAEIVRRPF